MFQRFKKRDCPLSDELRQSIEHPFEPPALTIRGHPTNRVAGAKSRFIGFDGEICSVEVIFCYIDFV